MYNRAVNRHSGMLGKVGRSPEEIPLTTVRTPLSDCDTDDEGSPRHRPPLVLQNKHANMQDNKKWKPNWNNR